MAVTPAVGALYAARFERNFYNRSKWRSLVEDHSSEVPHGDSLVINRDNTTVTVKNYSDASDMDAGERVDILGATISLDQDKYIRMYVDDKESRQVRPSIVNAVSLEAASQFATTFDSYIATQAIASIPASRVLPVFKVGASFNNIKDTPTEAVQNSIVASLSNAAELADELDWPEVGRTVVMSVKWKRALVDYLIRKNINFVSSMQTDAAFQNFAIAQTFGWMPVVDNKIAKTGANAFRAYYVLRGEGIAYAEQYSRQEILRHPDRMGDNIRRRIIYGAVRAHPDKVFTQAVSATN